MKCPKCGANMPDNAKFCVKCGTSLTIAATSAINPDEVNNNEVETKEANKIETQNVEQNNTNSSSSINDNKINEINETTNEVTNENVIENEQISSENTQETPQNVENVENQIEPETKENIANEANNNQANIESSNNPSNSSTSNASFGSKVKDLLIGSDKFFLARSVLMYAIIGGSTLVLFIMGTALGWSALMFIPLVGIGLGVLGYLQEIRKIEINADSLRKWNEKRPNNVVFKNKITNPDSLWSKFQYWHEFFKPSKYLALILSLIALLLFPTTLVTATVKTTTTLINKNKNGGGSSGYVRKYEGFYPDAEYVVKYQPWENLLYGIWDDIYGRESYNNPMGVSAGFTIASEYHDVSEVEGACSLAISMGYVLDDDSSDNFPRKNENGEEYLAMYRYFKKEWGPEVTWSNHRYRCTLIIEDMGWDSNYKSCYAYMKYMFFDDYYS